MKKGDRSNDIVLSIKSMEKRLGGRIDVIAKKLDSNYGRIGTLTKTVDRVATNLDRLTSKVIDMDEYLHEEVATKTELKEVETRLTGHTDGFAQQQNRFDAELAALASKVGRIEDQRGVV